MNIATIEVYGVYASAKAYTNIPAGLVGATITFEFADPKWNGLSRTAVFKGNVTRDVIMDGDVVRVPPETVATDGGRLMIGVYGVDGEENIVIPTLWTDIGPIMPAADPSGDPGTDPDLPIWAQLQSRVEALESDAPSDPDSPGTPGQPGEDGEDGGYYTPAVTQPSSDTVEFAFSPSKPDMPAVDPVQVKLPVSQNSGGNEVAFQFRGRINDLGYTSIGQCTEIGFYTFTTAHVSNLTDLPTGWTTGGYVVTLPYLNGSVWQWIGNTTARYVRASFTGSWYSDPMIDATLSQSGRAADAKAVGDKLKELGDRDATDAHNACYARYNTGSYAKSDARLMIYIEQPVGFLNIDMRHYNYNTDKGVADCWGIDNAYSVDFDAANNKSTQRFAITKDGEWEMAVRLKDASDFSGGGTHGDEKNSTVVLFVDGKKKDFSDIATVTKFTELKMIQKSDVYSCTEDGNSSKIAEHGTEWIYTKDGVTINQYLRWVGEHEVGNTFLAMFPVRKTATFNGNTINIVDTGYTNADFAEYMFVSNDGASFPDANEVAVYSAASGLHCVVVAEEYPTGLPGGDKITETDNGGQNYYKLYWPVTSTSSSDVAAYATTDGEIWKSRVHYNLTIGEGTAIS